MSEKKDFRHYFKTAKEIVLPIGIAIVTCLNFYIGLKLKPLVTSITVSSSISSNGGSGNSETSGRAGGGGGASGSGIVIIRYLTADAMPSSSGFFNFF